MSENTPIVGCTAVLRGSDSQDDNDPVPSLERCSDRSLSSASSQSLYDLNELSVFKEDSPTLKESRKQATAVLGELGHCKVQWGQVHIRFFPLIPGDHPDCLQGPPLSIAWDHVEEMSASVEDFETERCEDRFEGEQLRLNWYERRAKLLYCGFEENDLKKAEKQAHAVRRLRERTERNLNHERFEALHKVTERLGHAFRPKK